MNDQIQAEAPEDGQLILATEARAHLSVTRKWTLFLSVVGFIASGFLLIGGVVFALVLTYLQSSDLTPGRFPVAWFGVLYIIIGAISLASSYYLFRFSTKTKAALAAGDTAVLSEAFKSLRTHYAIAGISIITLIVFYFAVVIGVIFFSLSFTRNPFSAAYDAEHALRPKFEKTAIDRSDRRVLYDSTIAHPSVIQTRGSRVYYDGASISTSDAKGAGAVLEMIGYFNARHPNLDALYYKKGETYIIAFAVNESAFTDDGVAQAMQNGLAELHKTYGGRVYQFRLLAVDASGARREKLVSQN